MPVAIIINNDNAGIFDGEFINTLTTTAARCAGPLFFSSARNRDRYDIFAACSHHRRNRTGLRAIALRVGGVFDITANVHATLIVDKRCADYTDAAAEHPADRMRTSGIPYLDLTYADGVDPSRFRSASGTGCAGGAATGIAKIVHDPRGIDIGGDQILVAASTDPGWVFMMTVARGIVVEKGSVLSHTAIIGRELGIPTIVGVANATKRIPDGVEMSINGSTGEIRWQ